MAAHDSQKPVDAFSAAPRRGDARIDAEHQTARQRIRRRFVMETERGRSNGSPALLISTPCSAVRRRYRSVYAAVERSGGDGDTAQMIASLAVHLEQRRHARIEQPELVALCSVLALIDRHMAERAAREGGLAEAVA